MSKESDSPAGFVSVEVAYATPQKQCIIPLQVRSGTSAYQAVIDSGICSEFPALDPDSDPMGIFSNRLDGKQLPLPAEYQLMDGDRVEIYRPLLIDPKQARLKRAESKNTQGRH